ncbi:MAG TPA: hypothetical protein VGC68_00980 [Enterovirga sp.]
MNLADNRLATSLDGDTLDPDGLLTVAAVSLERFHLSREGAGELVECEADEKRRGDKMAAQLAELARRLEGRGCR